MTAAETRVRSLEEQQTKLEARLNPMSTTFVYGAAQQIDAIAEERRIREELRKTQADLAEARQQLATARQKLSDSGRNTPQASQY